MGSMCLAQHPSFEAQKHTRMRSGGGPDGNGVILYTPFVSELAAVFCGGGSVSVQTKLSITIPLQ